MQVDPNSINLTGTSTSSIGQDQNLEEELYAQLHRELETVDKRVTRANRRVILQRRVPIALVLGSGVGGQRGRGCRVQRGSTTMTYARRSRASNSKSQAHLDDDTSEEDKVEEEAVELEVEEVDLVDPEYDTDGNIITEGDYATSSSSDGDDYAATSSSSFDGDNSES